MDLKTYLKIKGLKQEDFAKLVGTTPSAISNYVCKRRFPVLAIALRIKKATKGKVSLNDLLEEKNG